MFTVVLIEERQTNGKPRQIYWPPWAPLMMTLPRLTVLMDFSDHGMDLSSSIHPMALE